jgi:hypothetical protein
MLSRVPLLAVLLLAIALFAACATPSAPPPAPSVWGLASASPAAGDDLRLRSGGRLTTVSFQGDQVVGPRVSFLHQPGLLRGAGLELRVRGDKVIGHTNTAPVTLELERMEDGFHVRGSVGWKYVDFALSRKSLEGRFGSCWYQLAWDGSRYDGLGGCGGSWAYLELPVTLTSWNDADVMTMLALLL